jgi:hypothetical protein
MFLHTRGFVLYAHYVQFKRFYTRQLIGLAFYMLCCVIFM